MARKAPAPSADLQQLVADADTGSTPAATPDRMPTAADQETLLRDIAARRDSTARRPL